MVALVTALKRNQRWWSAALPFLPGYCSTLINFQRQWRERQALEIQRRDELSTIRNTETTQKARQAIDDFYDSYNNKRQRLIDETRREAQEYLDNRENTAAGGTAWERIAKLVDLSDKGSRGIVDKTRFREMLLSLKNDQNVSFLIKLV